MGIQRRVFSVLYTTVVACVLALGLVVGAHASPFLTADPYPASGPLPDEFILSFNGQADVVVPARINADGSRDLWYDLAPLIGSGQRTVTARARNAESTSGLSDPLSFNTNWLTAPTNLRICITAVQC